MFISESCTVEVVSIGIKDTNYLKKISNKTAKYLSYVNLEILFGWIGLLQWFFHIQDVHVACHITKIFVVTFHGFVLVLL